MRAPLTDPVERIVAEALQAAGVSFTHESEDKSQRLDFYLPTHKVFIECKAFPSDRTARQIAQTNNVILVQGRAAAQALAEMIAPSRFTAPDIEER